MHICLGWNFYLSTILTLGITALYTIAGMAPTAGRSTQGTCKRGRRPPLLQARGSSPGSGPSRSPRSSSLCPSSLGPVPSPATLLPLAGGLAAVIYTDALQTLIMVVGAVILTIKGEDKVCGHGGAIPTASPVESGTAWHSAGLMLLGLWVASLGVGGFRRLSH